MINNIKSIIIHITAQIAVILFFPTLVRIYLIEKTFCNSQNCVKNNNNNVHAVEDKQKTNEC